MDTKKLEKARSLMQEAMDLVESCYSGSGMDEPANTNPDGDSGDDDGDMNSLRMKLGKYKD